MVELEPLDDADREWLRATVERHRELTGSTVAERLLDAWESEVEAFRKVMPKDYQPRARRSCARRSASGCREEETDVKVMESAHG